MQLEQVWLKHQELFRSIVRSILLDHSLIDDVLQEAFIRTLKSGKTFTDDLEAFNYLRRAVVHTAYDFYRRAKRYYARFQPHQDLGSFSEPSRQQQDPLSWLLRQENDRQHEHLIDRLRHHVRHLSPQHREALELFLSRPRGCKLKDICRDRGIPYSTLRSRFLRALDLLEAKLRQEEDISYEVEAS